MEKNRSFTTDAHKDIDTFNEPSHQKSHLVMILVRQNGNVIMDITVVRDNI